MRASVRGTLLHIGSGDGSELPLHIATGAERIILVEPNPEHVARLGVLAAQADNITVLPQAIAERGTEAELAVYNMPGLASFTPPTGSLRQIYPGLRISGRHSVETLTPADLRDRLGDMPAPVRLILDAPGTETVLLTAWQADDTLSGIDDIELRCAAEPAFEGSASCAELCQLLENACFEPSGRDFSDPDWPVLSFRFDRAGAALRAEKLRVRALEERLAETDAARDEAVKSAETARAALAEVQSRLDDLGPKADWRADRIKQLEEQHAEALADHATQAKDHAALKSNLDLALRMQAMSAADLSDLRKRYETLLARKEGQDNLISQLVVRLEEASGHLRGLAADQAFAPDALPATSSATPEDPEPATKKAGSPRKARG
ncbi:hypothetical protein [Sulfitobacter sabulilitoris]|uniref:FkbM family methyltransferase n=1 Tax=Sulfitobacter sabulilitoris TaxID=2562655 RepID=A0A5S3P7T2_9RHOB|nr:hypothetical protein [Sulfitobacter sabulilitoris]TMM49377.1 hypothetical protein FDT80_18220 [Sulfitobacter sabulilitoris]